jgi:hypothetical protein
MSLAACRPCRRPPRASTSRARAWGVWEELSAASLPHPGKLKRRSMKIEWRNEDEEGEGGDGGRSCALLVRACLFSCACPRLFV